MQQPVNYIVNGGLIHPNPNPYEAQRESLAMITRKLLKGGWSWRIYCFVSSALSLAAMVGFLAILEADKWTRLGFIIYFIFLASSVVWLSVQTRDRRKKVLFDAYGKDIPDLVSKGQAIGNSWMRLSVSIACTLASIVFFALLLAFSNNEWDYMTGLNFCIVTVIIIINVFQQAKSAHDVTDAKMLKATQATLPRQPYIGAPQGQQQMPPPMAPPLVPGEGVEAHHQV